MPTYHHLTSEERYYILNHHPWERGTNENTNGLLRQYIPTGTKMKFAERIVREGVKRINSRPRKVLEYRTAEEVFFRAFRVLHLKF